jgi:hypothetical protein
VAVAECAASWDPRREDSWHVFSDNAPPLGFDPAGMFPGGLTDPQAAILVLRPWPLRWAFPADLTQGRPHTVWRAERLVPA